MAKRDVVKRLKPRGKRIDEAAKRLRSRAMDSYAKNADVVVRAPLALDKMKKDYYDGRRSAEAELGYAPGEKISRSVSGTDRYSGSSYRIGKGTPRYPEYPMAEESKIRNNLLKVEKLRERSTGRMGIRESKAEIKSRLSSVQRAAPRKSAKGKVVKGVATAATVAAIVSAVMRELNKK